MNRFRIKLNGMEMKMLSVVSVHVAKSVWPVGSIADLVVTDTLERIWSRLRKMYRPDRYRYTVRLSAVETSVVTDWIVPTLLATDEPMLQSLGSRLEQELDNQINRECNIYNAMGYGR